MHRIIPSNPGLKGNVCKLIFAGYYEGNGNFHKLIAA